VADRVRRAHHPAGGAPRFSRVDGAVPARVLQAGFLGAAGTGRADSASRTGIPRALRGAAAPGRREVRRLAPGRRPNGLALGRARLDSFAALRRRGRLLRPRGLDLRQREAGRVRPPHPLSPGGPRAAKTLDRRRRDRAFPGPEDRSPRLRTPLPPELLPLDDEIPQHIWKSARARAAAPGRRSSRPASSRFRRFPRRESSGRRLDGRPARTRARRRSAPRLRRASRRRRLRRAKRFTR
jgi:hypothetical protein